jgi:hypothetical protein
MNPHAGKIVLNDATSQYDRWLRALDADYAKVDGRSYDELLDFAVSYAGLINFYNLRDKVDGDWVLFFLTDPTMLLASIGVVDLSAVEAAFALLERLTAEAQDFDRKFQLLRQTFESILDLARRLNVYLGLPGQSGETGQLLEHMLDDMIEQDLGGQLRALKAFDEGAGLPGALGRPVGLDYSGFAANWGLGQVCPDGSIYRGRTNDKKIDYALPRLNTIFRSFLYAFSDLKQFARANLPATLDTGDHKPHVALYLAFVQLFQTAQNTLNTISHRYVNFYYRDILREGNRGPVADSVYLTFTLAESEEVLSTTVPRGTLFAAGQDAEGQDILYASDKDLGVDASSIGKVRTLRVISGSPFIAEPKAEASYEEAASREREASDEDAPPVVVNRVLASEIVMGADAGADMADAAKPGAQTDWGTFGEERVGSSAVEVTEPATLGFAVASDLLLLTGGTRIVTLEVSYTATFKENVLNPLLGQLSTATGLRACDIFRLVLEGAFTLYVSTSTGWFEVEAYGAATTGAQEADELSFGLWFELPPSVPSVVPYDPEGEGADGESGTAAPVTEDTRVNASSPAPSLPTLKAYVRQELIHLVGDVGAVNVYPLSLLAEMEVTSIRIRAQVFDLSNMQLANTDGEIDTSTPFFPFGGLPVVGSYLLIRHSELFVKTIESLLIRVFWFNLPPNDDGFRGYYKYYVIGPDGSREPNLFNNQVFRNSLSVQNPGTWSFGEFASPGAYGTSPPQEDYYLFRTRENCTDPTPTEAGTLCADTVFAPTVSAVTPPRYYDPEDSAFKLELTAPSYAFGNSIYSQNILNAVIEDLPDPVGCKEKCRAECQVLTDAAMCIDACIMCLKDCDAATGGADPACVETCLERCLLCLLELAVPCIERCLASAGTRAGGQLPPYFKKRMRAALSLPAPERVRVIRQCVDECRELLGKDSPPSESCTEKCLKLFEAMQCVVLCASGLSSPPFASLGECLGACSENLRRAGEECEETCIAECMSLKKELKYPNEPYLPQSTKLTLDYTADCTLPLVGAVDPCAQFFHLLPFGGYARIDTSAKESPALPPTLLPSFTYPGNLYLGFSALTPPRMLTLLFQMAADAGGARPEPLPPVVWEYLSENRWKRLNKSQLYLDTTNGLQQSGIVELSLPSYDPSNNTVLSADLEWLRASVASQPGGFPRCAGLYTHAVLATWRNEDNTGEQLAKPLPPHTISGSVEPLPDIATIDQPIESFGGRPPETGRDFEMRVGERLRHKDRAILGWDYERLVLERFPTVWKVQALPARNPQTGNAPGEVLLVVVNGTDSIQTVDPTASFVTGEMLGNIQSYLESRASPFIQLYVVNPIYVRIEVTASVEFGAAASVGASLVQLNAELVEYLSPWFYDAARAARGGLYASESDISEFIQTRPYVEALSSITFNYAPPPDSLDWYFLTSARQHRIQDAGASVVAYERAGY